MEDLEAIHRLKNGDIGGLEILIARYQVKAVRTAYLVTHDVQIAEEVVQDAYIRFYDRASHFDSNRAFEPYFLRMVVNLALNKIEREARSTSSPGDDGMPGIESLLDFASSVEDQVVFEQSKRQINRAIGALPPRQRAAIVQRYYLEMSEKEMSKTLDIPPGTVKWLLHAARNRLRKLLTWQRSDV